MVILKHGVAYKEIDCNTCKARLGYSKNDIVVKMYIDDCMGEEHGIHKEYLICPECNNKIFLKYFIDDEDQLKK